VVLAIGTGSAIRDAGFSVPLADPHEGTRALEIGATRVGGPAGSVHLIRSCVLVYIGLRTPLPQPTLLLVFNNSVRRSRPSCHLPVGAHVMSGELVKLSLAGAIWVLSFLARHCVPEHVGNLIKLAAC
jgi:hypothetical protein